MHTFSLKIHWKFKNFVFFGDVFLMIMELSAQVLPPFFMRSCLLIVLLEGDLIAGRVWRNSPDGGLPLPFCFFMGTWLQVGSEGILLRMAFPFCFVFARGTWLWNYFALHWNMFSHWLKNFVPNLYDITLRAKRRQFSIILLYKHKNEHIIWKPE